MKPYAKLIPASEIDSVHAVQKMLGAESKSELKQWQAMRGENRMDVFIVSRVGNPSAPPNPRASAIVTDIEGPAAKGRGSMIDVEGPNVLIRGDAIAMRWGFIYDGGQNRVRICQKRGIRDFGWKDFDNKWGYFQMALLPGTNLAAATPLPNTPEGLRQGMSLMNMISEAFRGRDISEEDVFESCEREQALNRGGGGAGRGARGRGSRGGYGRKK